MGADADLPGWLDEDLTVPLFQKTYDLFKKCFGSSTLRRAYTGCVAWARLMVKHDSVGCPADRCYEFLTHVSTAIINPHIYTTAPD